MHLGASLLQTKVEQAALEIQHETTAYSDPLHSQVSDYQVQKKRCSNIEREALGILHSLKKFHHYCLTREGRLITDHKPLVTILTKDVVTLSQRL